jgi:TerC family integral membrane protein
MLARPNHGPHPERGRLFRVVKKVIPTTQDDHGSRLFAREGGLWKATPFFLILLMVELTDIVFAVDSILAIFAITTDPFIVFTSNIFAVMGMRSLFFLLAGMAKRFVYLQPGLALVLVFVGAKMALMEWVKLPVIVSLSVVSVLLGGSIIASLVKTRRRKGPPTPLPDEVIPYFRQEQAT